MIEQVIFNFAVVTESEQLAHFHVPLGLCVVQGVSQFFQI